MNRCFKFPSNEKSPKTFAICFRFVVRIDSWDVGSLYPNGHFVKSLGPAGNVETEIASILMEHGLSVVPFSEGILKEMPINTKENQWKMTDEEMQRRKDLRYEYILLFSNLFGRKIENIKKMLLSF